MEFPKHLYRMFLTNAAFPLSLLLNVAQETVPGPVLLYQDIY